jgi:histidinol-phosphatase
VNDLAAAHAAALALAEEADALSLRYFNAGVEAHAKADGTPVTRADREVEALARRRLADAFPSHALAGEEEGGAIDPAVPTWIVDPIDGTKNFIRGIPVWATLIALVVGGTPVVGVASAPAMGERWDAAAGHGARRNGAAVAVSAVDTLATTHLMVGGLSWFRRSPRHWALLGDLVDEAWRTRGFGDFWMHLLVAGGMADAALERDVNDWDVAAPACIVTEAGGTMTAWDGGPLLGSGEALTSNGRLHPLLVERLRPES